MYCFSDAFKLICLLTLLAFFIVQHLFFFKMCLINQFDFVQVRLEILRIDQSIPRKKKKENKLFLYLESKTWILRAALRAVSK